MPRIRRMATLLRALAFVLPVAFPVAGARAGDFPLRSPDRPRFLADVVAVPTPAGSVQVAVSWDIPYPELVFRKGDDWYRARYDVAVVVLSAGRQIDGDVWRRRVRVSGLDETRSEQGRATGRKVLVLPATTFRVRITVTDRSSQLASGVEGTVEAAFRVSGVGLGGLRFVHYVDGEAIVNAAHEIPLGEAGHAVRVDLRPAPNVTGEVRLGWRIRDASRETVFRGDSTVVLSGAPVSLEIDLSTTDLPVGASDLEVRAEGPGKETDRRTARLHVRLTPRWFESHRGEALEVFEVLSGGEELEALKGAREGEWSQQVVEFWARRDPSPGRDGNEYRDMVQSRMETAATLFVEPFRSPGWRTDRGRVLLEYGTPARRSTQSSDFERAASELWEYESPRRVFLFVDERGSGEYWRQG